MTYKSVYKQNHFPSTIMVTEESLESFKKSFTEHLHGIIQQQGPGDLVDLEEQTLQSTRTVQFNVWEAKQVWKEASAWMINPW